jgi:hypothetical protein
VSETVQAAPARVKRSSRGGLAGVVVVAAAATTASYWSTGFHATPLTAALAPTATAPTTWWANVPVERS